MTAPSVPWTLTRLGAELSQFDARVVGENRVVSGVCQDSRRISVGDLFAVRAGNAQNSDRFVPEAMERGASALLCDASLGADASQAARLVVSDVQGALAVAAELVYGAPSSALHLTGITGTNGKTTTATLAAQCLNLLGRSCAQLGTLGYEFRGVAESFGLTTPEADFISKTLRRAVDEGATDAMMEVSSHALIQRRVHALSFEVAAFSNLTQDHLDFHGSLEAYGEAKASLFLDCRPRRSVINTDDAFGRALSRRIPGAICVGRDEDATLRLLGEEDLGAERLLRVQTAQGTVSFRTRLFGAHNTENWLLTLGILSALECDLQRLPAVSGDVQAARGRFERCDGEDDDIAVVVDYAHTPDALRRVLQAARPLTRGRLISVIGCGGDRDAGKREPMGAEAAAASDYVVITNDNPRSEDPKAIAASIERGVVRQRPAVSYEVLLDRRVAIDRAISMADPGDMVVIAGKGHEDYQIIGKERFHFDDKLEALRALGERRHRRKDD